MSVLAKGYVFQFRVSNDPRARLNECREINFARFQWVFLHDPQGRGIPSCQVVIKRGRMRPGAPAQNVSREAVRYFGDIPIYEMDMRIPATRQVQWRSLGYCRQIYYDRISERMLTTGQDPFQHPYKAYREEYENAALGVATINHERVYLLDLGPSCIVNERGFVKP